MAKPREFTVRFTKANDIQTVLEQRVKAETDAAAIMMAIYNMRDAGDSWRLAAVVPSVTFGET
jgi:predicted DNA-binding protein with PD1-like motif